VNKKIRNFVEIVFFSFVSRFLYRDAQVNRDRDIDLLEVLTLLARNPNGL
jgi:hypothetical protein